MTTATRTLPKNRLVSLDIFRGLTMFLLIAEGTSLYHALDESFAPGSFGDAFIRQFHHHPWNGLRFWDLIQPFFMFIVGVAMWFSIQQRQRAGANWNQHFRHIAERCLILLAFGVILHIGYNKALVWELWNVLSQLSITILIAFLIMRLPDRTQILISIGLLVLTELLYRFTHIPGYDQPFVKDHNFGAYMDMVLMGKINPGGGWVAINCIPTAAHTIWGVLAGKLIAGPAPEKKKIQTLLIAGAIGLVVGYTLDWTGVTPIIKRICTSSFVLASGGWCLVVLALMYWIIDVKKNNTNLKFWFPVLTIGMNPIFLYMFMETVGHQWFRDYVAIYTFGILEPLSISETRIAVVNAVLVLTLVSLLSIWLYRKRLFFKI